MYFLNLSITQFLAMFGSLSAVMVALYLLDRSRRRQVVATLRFWVAAEQPAVVQKRKKIQQPLSLLLQLLSMLLLLLAIAQLRLGSPLGTPRDHVVILDTSAWMSAAPGNSRSTRTLMDEARAKVRAYLKALPSSDRVMLVRADALATPVTAFESDRARLEQAVAQSTPGHTALNLDQAIAFARRAQALGARRAGEIVYAGAGRVAAGQPLDSPPPPKNLRVLQVADPVENCGLRKVGVRRSVTDPDVWDIYASVRNYGTAPRNLTLNLQFAKSPAGVRRITVPPGAEREITFEYRTRIEGLLEATLLPHDRFPEDDHAVLDLPAQPSLAVTVYSSAPDLLRPIVTAIPRVRAVFRSPGEYRAGADQGLIILDRFRPAAPPSTNAIWIEPPSEASPIPVRAKLENVPFERWCSDNPLCAGLRTKDVRLAATEVFEAAPDDVRIGQVAAGPVIVARAGKYKTVVFGFHPALSDLRYELAAPLLFANILRWMSPELFRRSALAAGSAGMVTAELDADLRPADVRVLEEDGTPVPFTSRGHTLRFFAGTPGTVRVQAADRETVYSLNLPELWESRWDFPPAAKSGMPAFREAAASSLDLWRALAILGGLGLLAEWILFGRATRRIRLALKKWGGPPGPRPTPTSASPAHALPGPNDAVRTTGSTSKS